MVGLGKSVAVEFLGRGCWESILHFVGSINFNDLCKSECPRKS